jgi:hypothetical protein
MPDNRSEKYRKAFTQGQEAVRRRPRYAPANPYEEIDPKTGKREIDLHASKRILSSHLCSICSTILIEKMKYRSHRL